MRNLLHCIYLHNPLFYKYIKRCIALFVLVQRLFKTSWKIFAKLWKFQINDSFLSNFLFHFSVIRILHKWIIYRMDLVCYRFPRNGTQIFSFGSNKMDIIFKSMNKGLDHFKVKCKHRKLWSRTLFRQFWWLALPLNMICQIRRDKSCCSGWWSEPFLLFHKRLDTQCSMSISFAWTIGCANVTKRILGIQSIRIWFCCCSCAINSNLIKMP